MSEPKEKGKRGRPVKNKIEKIDATAEEIAAAIFAAADCEEEDKREEKMDTQGKSNRRTDR